jgi:hypothetical protein
MDYYSAIKNNEIMTFVGKWIILEINMSGKMRQTLKGEYQLFFSHIWKLDQKNEKLPKYKRESFWKM